MSFAASSTVEVPPFQLQELIPYVFAHDVPDSGLGFSGPPAPVKPVVTYAQALGSEIYIGCSDGGLFRFALQANGPDAPDSYTLLSHQTVPTHKRIDEIALCPSVSRAMVLTANQIHFYTIPSLDPVPTHVIRPMRNVVSFAVDEQHMRLPLSTDPPNQIPPVNVCIIKNNNIAMYALKERIVLQKEIPFSGLRYGRRSGRYFCGSDKEHYIMIDLLENISIPLLPFNQAGDGTSTRPCVVPISDEEYLVLSNMGVGAMGVFISSAGDPVRGTLEWDEYPRSICLDYPYLSVLLPSGVINIHSIETQAIVQVIPVPNTLSSDIFVPSYGGYLVPSTQRTEKLGLLSVSLSDFSTQSVLKSSFRPPVFPRSNVLLASENTVFSLLPSTLISQADALLDMRKRDDVVDLAEQSQRKVLGSTAADEDLADELRYVSQRLGWECFSETLFEDAGKHHLAGETDPRLLVHYFPSLRGNLLDDARVEVFGGIVKYLPGENSIDEIVMADLVKNYSPHIQPSVEDAPPTAELRRILCTTAEDMLLSYLLKWRTRRLVGPQSAKAGVSHINVVVDTVLAKLFAARDSISELYGLIDATNNIVIDEVESLFEKNGQYNALCKLHAAAGNEDKLLECWSKLVDGTWSDEDIKDPLSNMTDLLQKSSDRTKTQRWALWLLEHDPKAGLKLIISRGARRASVADELALLAKIKTASTEAGVEYLEHLVIHKGVQDASLLNQLSNVYIDSVISFMSDETTSKLWRAKASSYSSKSDAPFILYFASTTPDSPSRSARLKTLLLLSSPLPYNASAILSKLHSHTQSYLLKPEIAVLQGKLGQHEECLRTLVKDVGDCVSAEAYCALGGTWVISPKVRMLVGERCGLQRWATLGTASHVPRSRTTSSMTFTEASLNGVVAAGAVPLAVAPSMASLKSSAGDEQTRAELLKVLLSVYMSGGPTSIARTSRLLNAQSLNLDPTSILPLLPPSSPLSAYKPYLTAHLRLITRQRHEGAIVKALSAGQNHEVVFKSWAKLREAGAVIEEAADDDSFSGDEKDVLEDEKSTLREEINDEKASLGHVDVGRTKKLPPIVSDEQSQEISDLR